MGWPNRCWEVINPKFTDGVFSSIIDRHGGDTCRHTVAVLHGKINKSIEFVSE